MWFLTKWTRVKIVDDWALFSSYEDMANEMWLKHFSKWYWVDVILNWLKWTIVAVKKHPMRSDYIYWVALDNWHDILILTTWVERLDSSKATVVADSDNVLIEKWSIVIFELSEELIFKYGVGYTFLSCTNWYPNNKIFDYIEPRKVELAKMSYWYNPIRSWLRPTSKDGDYKWLRNLVLNIMHELHKWKYPDARLYVNDVEVLFAKQQSNNKVKDEEVIKDSDVNIDVLLTLSKSLISIKESLDSIDKRLKLLESK